MAGASRIDLDAQKRAKEQLRNAVPSIRYGDSSPTSVQNNKYHKPQTSHHQKINDQLN